MAYEIRELPQTDWPELLHEIPDKPKKLFLAGSLPHKNNKILTVVGSRKYSPYGKEVCESLLEGLKGYPITIVSGLALGIDSIAHKSALKHGLQTIAVPGSGLSPKVLYPKSHVHLAEEITESGGGLLSEFEPDFDATKWSFPQRNRIMAGMSHAVLVVEAEEKSGTLITSRLATEYNREVLTVPGSIFSSQSAGPHMLIRLGATPVTKPEDILEALSIEAEAQSQKEIDMSALSEDEQKIVKTLGQRSLEKDLLIQNSGLEISRAQIALMSLEIKGFIKEISSEISLKF
ncbi:MAG: DNA-protecting protein DprA [Candidatus Zambryskibacteria bacterium CG10_big_fil_rev_8_21_14_0_10_42_12]|uniref:DNA-protecting protein DprA n=1 Tax=Candidatus Zambryskibacteria bacterium CG10_big_fil_rev_8_21_14_0_10_42_12 TaxID=1975115 RepID=A0A2H0QVG6_9BACT|nr:MAG: DNA-protecting protein DprA [Candidatus Zambryskibacteria bacterium CG10_big_fil_rev_8_21_14_0_10_42_12]